jgi:hypothetical protein
MFYEYQLIPFSVITVVAVGVATYYVLQAMDKIFGKAVYPEKTVVRRTLLVMAFIVLWRVCGIFVLSFDVAKLV